jgi:hypothetical protein
LISEASDNKGGKKLRGGVLAERTRVVYELSRSGWTYLDLYEYLNLELDFTLLRLPDDENIRDFNRATILEIAIGVEWSRCSAMQCRISGELQSSSPSKSHILSL